MKLVQTVLLKVMSLMLLIGGVALVILWLRFPAYVQMVHEYKAYFWTYGGVGAAGFAALIGLLGILPLGGQKRAKHMIVFPGTRGDVTIELDSVEANLGRVMAKMPEVKRIKVKLTPSEDNHRALVTADVRMYKGAGGASAREIANRIADHLMDTAVNILGEEEVTKVNLTVRDIIVDAKQLSVARVQDVPARHEEAIEVHPASETVAKVLEETPAVENAKDPAVGIGTLLPSHAESKSAPPLEMEDPIVATAAAHEETLSSWEPIPASASEVESVPEKPGGGSMGFADEHPSSGFEEKDPGALNPPPEDEHPTHTTSAG